MLWLYLFFIAVVIQERRAKQLVGGTYPTMQNAAYQAAFVRFDQEKDQFQVICGGTIVSKYEILTSASCAEKIDSTNDKVHVGSNFIDETCGSRYNIINIKPHESYVQGSVLSAYDIAVVRVEGPINCLHCKSIYLAEKNKKRLSPGEEVRVSGYGEKVDFGAGILRMMNLTVDPHGCNQVLKEGQKCASPWNNEQSVVGPCEGDLGGPVVSFRLVGILINSGLSPCKRKTPAVFIEVAPMRDWIDKNVINKNPDSLPHTQIEGVGG